jgi:hypothetical protein
MRATTRLTPQKMHETQLHIESIYYTSASLWVILKDRQYLTNLAGSETIKSLLMNQLQNKILLAFCTRIGLLFKKVHHTFRIKI